MTFPERVRFQKALQAYRIIKKAYAQRIYKTILHSLMKFIVRIYALLKSVAFTFLNIMLTYFVIRLVLGLIERVFTRSSSYSLTWRSTLTILDDKLTLDSYTSLSLLPDLPRIWSNLNTNHKQDYKLIEYLKV